MPRRLAGWDYASNGAYFITVCAYRRARVFGAVSGAAVELSALGALLASQMVTLTRDHAGARLDTWMIMPDHVHLLVLHVGEERGRISVELLVAALKAHVTREARCGGILAMQQPLWQRGFYDRVIRSDEELQSCREYIATNPIRWALRGR
jgi:REP element-mobilizing transposase RayT